MPIFSDINSYHDITNNDKAIQGNILSNEESVYQSINNILTTTVGERLFNPEFGSTMEDILFSINDTTTELVLFDLIIGAIEKFEKRVDIDTSISKVTTDIESHKINISLAFKIRGLGDQTFTHNGTIGV